MHASTGPVLSNEPHQLGHARDRRRRGAPDRGTRRFPAPMAGRNRTRADRGLEVVDHRWNVYSVVRDGGTIYIGGDFDTGGSAATGDGSPWIRAPSVALQPYPTVTGTVVTRGAGRERWLVPGWVFHGVAGAATQQSRPRGCQRESDGLEPSIRTAPIDALRGERGTIYVAGSFTHIGGQWASWRRRARCVQRRCHRLESEPGGVYALAVSGGTVYAGGTFGVAALDAAQRWRRLVLERERPGR